METSVDFFSPDSHNLRVFINPEYDSFPVIEKNGSIEIDFIPSPQKMSNSNIIEFNLPSAPQKQISIEKYQEQVLVSQLPPSIVTLNEKEKVQVTKVLEETSSNASLVKTYNNEVLPILDGPFLYTSTKQEMIFEKMNNLLRKQPAPQNLRKRIWPYLIGNKLKINKKLYKNLETQMKINPPCEKAACLIRDDMYRTYPNFSLFDKGSQTNETLQRILEQFNYFRPDMGYVQGMAYPAAILYLYLGNSYLTFKYFNNLVIGNEFIQNLYKFKIEKVKLYIKTFDFFLSQKYPKCTQHLQKLHIQSDIFLIEWFYTLYCRAFSFTTVAKIWDLMLTQGEVVFYKVGISIFGCIEKDLMDKDFDDTLFLIRSCTGKIDPDTLIKSIYSQKLTKDTLFKKYQKNMEEMQLFEKLQKKKENSSPISSSTSLSSSNGNSGSKSQENNNNLLKTPGLETIDEMNSSTHSAQIIQNISQEEQHQDDFITINSNNNQQKDNLNYQRTNNSNKKQTIKLQKIESPYNNSDNNLESNQEEIINSNVIQEIA